MLNLKRLLHLLFSLAADEESYWPANVRPVCSVCHSKGLLSQRRAPPADLDLDVICQLPLWQREHSSNHPPDTQSVDRSLPT